MRLGWICQAAELTVKIGKLHNEGLTNQLKNVDWKSTSQLWAAINQTVKLATHNTKTDLLSDHDAVNKYFANIATDPTYV
jgi:hypothetical protein